MPIRKPRPISGQQADPRRQFMLEKLRRMQQPRGQGAALPAEGRAQDEQRQEMAMRAAEAMQGGGSTGLIRKLPRQGVPVEGMGDFRRAEDEAMMAQQKWEMLQQREQEAGLQQQPIAAPQAPPNPMRPTPMPGVNPPGVPSARPVMPGGRKRYREPWRQKLLKPLQGRRFF